MRHLDPPTGTNAGDNVGFLWNFWWMRMPWSSGLDFFHTTFLFVPTGTELTLHTHTALPSFVGATLFGQFPLVVAHNLTVLIGLALNGFCAYLLAWRVTRDYGAAIIGGLVFGGSPYIAAHLYGHFNLTTAWTIPLFALAMWEATRGSTKWAVLAGLIQGATAFIDYYYFVFQAALALCIAACGALDWSIAVRGVGTGSRRLAQAIVILIIADLAIIAAIVFSGGIETPLGAIRSARSIFNPLQGFWLLLLIFLWLQLRPRVDVQPRDGAALGRAARSLAVVVAISVALASPLIWQLLRLLASGDYVTKHQTIHQRPLVGGYISRIPRDVTTAYDEDPLLSGLLGLSARAGIEGLSPQPDRALASTRLRENGIRFIVLNRMSASPALVEYVEGVLPVTLIEKADGRSLYLVRDTFGP